MAVTTGGEFYPLPPLDFSKQELKVPTLELKKSEWKTIEEERPPYNKKVLIFRSLKGKYATGYLCKGDENREEACDYWVTEWGTCHNAYLNDAWMSFPPYGCYKEYG